MKNLTEKDIIEIMREEWKTKLSSLTEAVSIVFDTNVDGKKKPVISAGLKVRNKVKSKSSDGDPKGYLYTVATVTQKGATLKTPEGNLISISREELEKNYEVD